MKNTQRHRFDKNFSFFRSLFTFKRHIAYQASQMTTENMIQKYSKAPLKDTVSEDHIEKCTNKTDVTKLVGIEIPDYVSSPNKGTILKTIQNRYKLNFEH